MASSGGATGEGDSASPYCSDDFLAARLSERLGEDWKSTPDGRWFHWDGKRYREEKTHKVLAISREVCRAVARDVEAAKLARDVAGKTKIYAAVALAAVDRRHMTPLESFDADPYLLNTPGGTVDLRNGRIRQHDRADLLSRIAAAGPVGKAAVFSVFLDEATGGDKELQRFLARVAGYCLTGSIDEHAIFFLHDNGLGMTGKSTFINVMFGLLGDYATTAPMELFTVATGERHPAELATLHSVRLVTASETEEGRRWDEAKLKAITGGDPITARFMRGNFFTFRPNFKLLMAGNHRPRMRSADQAMRRRFHMIPFLHRPKNPDQALSEKLRQEFPGIVAWAIEGELERQRIGLAPPPAVVAATNEYFQTENTIGRWMDERCARGSDRTALTRDLYRDFKSWASLAGEYSVSERVFSQKLQQQSGIERWQHPVTRRMGFCGLAPLVATDELPLDGHNCVTRPAAGKAEPSTSRTYNEAGEWEVDEL